MGEKDEGQKESLIRGTGHPGEGETRETRTITVRESDIEDIDTQPERTWTLEAHILMKKTQRDKSKKTRWPWTKAKEKKKERKEFVIKGKEKKGKRIRALGP